MTEQQSGENKRFEEQTEVKTTIKCGASNGKKLHACYSCEHLIKTCTKQRNIFFKYNEIREMTERDMITIMEEYVTIKRLKVQNNIHTNNN